MSISDRYAELHALLARKRLEEDVVAELEHHFDALVERYLAEGMGEEDARAAALARFGDIDRVRAETTAVDRSAHRRREVGEIAHDVTRSIRLAARRLRRRPEFSVFALLTLTIAIGAFSALYTVLESLVLRPLPYDESDRLVALDSPVPGVGPEAAWGLSVAGYFDFADDAAALASIGAYSVGSANLLSDAGPARVLSAAVSASLLETLRLRPEEGRLFSEAEDVIGGPAVALLDHGFWQTRYGGDPGAVGRTLRLSDTSYEIVGVLEEGAGLPDTQVDIWRPIQLDPTAPPVNAHWVAAIARLSDDATVEGAGAEIDGRTAGFVHRFPQAYTPAFMRESGFRTRVEPLKDRVLGDASRTIWILFAAAGLLLLIALANITNLYLVRTEARRRDYEVRAALGASRRHLTWQSLSETLLLCTAAGVLALPLAQAGVAVLRATAPAGLPRLTELGLGMGTVVFTLSVGVALGAFLGLIPLVYRAFGSGDGVVQHSGVRSTASRSRQRARRTMLAGQMALALVLLAAGGLMLRSLLQLRSTEPGFESENVLVMETFIPRSAYGGYEPVGQFYREFLDRLEALPGVERAGATTRLPILDVGFCAAIFIEDRPLADGEAPPCVPVGLATPGFFETLSIPIDGEAPNWASMTDGSGSVVVTEALANRMWPGESPIGKGIRGNGETEPFYRVRGVVSDYRSDGLDRPPVEAVFFPMLPIEGAPLWSPPNAMSVVVKTGGDPTSFVPAIRSVLRDMNPEIPLANIRDYREAVWSAPSIARTSFSLLLLGVAAALALLLSTIGMYGVVSQLIAERSSEIAVRLALGAHIRQVIGMVMSQSLRIAVVGVAVGIIGALATTRILATSLFEVAPTDPVTLGAATATLLATVATATYLAARRAGRVDPIEMLRAE